MLKTTVSASIITPLFIFVLPVFLGLQCILYSDIIMTSNEAAIMTVHSYDPHMSGIVHVIIIIIAACPRR